VSELRRGHLQLGHRRRLLPEMRRRELRHNLRRHDLPDVPRWSIRCGCRLYRLHGVRSGHLPERERCWKLHELPCWAIPGRIRGRRLHRLRCRMDPGHVWPKVGLRELQPWYFQRQQRRGGLQRLRFRILFVRAGLVELHGLRCRHVPGNKQAGQLYKVRCGNDCDSRLVVLHQLSGR